MRILGQYIQKMILLATLLVWFGMVGLECLVVFIGELTEVGTGNYGIFNALQYALLTLPANLYSIFPMICLLGAVLGLGNLSSSSEMIAMRAAGMSIFRIVGLSIRSLLGLFLIMMLIGEGVGPYASHLAEVNKAIAQSDGRIVKTLEGVWLKDGHRFIHVETVLPGMQLQGVDEYDVMPSHRLKKIRHTASAVFKNGQWQLYRVVTMDIENEMVKTRVVSEAPWEVSLNPDLLSIAKIEASELTFPKLIQLIRYQLSNKLNADAYLLNFWQRLLQPFAVLVMILLSVPFVLGPLRSSPIGVRMVMGIVIGFIFYLSNQFFGPLSLVYQFSPFFAAALPSIIIFLFAVFWLRKI